MVHLLICRIINCVGRKKQSTFKPSVVARQRRQTETPSTPSQLSQNSQQSQQEVLSNETTSQNTQTESLINVSQQEINQNTETKEVTEETINLSSDNKETEAEEEIEEQDDFFMEGTQILSQLPQELPLIVPPEVEIHQEEVNKKRKGLF